MVSASISSRSSGLPPCAPQRREVVERAVGLGVLANAELPQRVACKRRRLQRAQLPVGQPVVHARQAVRVVELGGDHRRHAERHQVTAVFGGQRAQHPHQRQVGRRPRLVEPFLADRPAAVMGQPRQVGVQDEGEQPGDGLGPAGAGPHGRTAIATRSGCRRCSRSAASIEVEVVGGHRRDVGEQIVGPRRVGQRARDLGVDDRAAVSGVELGAAARRGRPRASTRSEKPATVSSSVSSAALSSRVWNGLIGVSRPGEKVIRLGVDISSTPAGRSTRRHSATNCP